MPEIKLEALSQYERETHTIQEHLGEVSYKIHVDSWPRLLGLLPPKISLVWLTTLQIIMYYNRLWFPNDQNKSLNIKHSFWAMTYVNPSTVLPTKCPR